MVRKGGYQTNEQCTDHDIWSGHDGAAKDDVSVMQMVSLLCERHACMHILADNDAGMTKCKMHCSLTVRPQALRADTNLSQVIRNSWML